MVQDLIFVGEDKNWFSQVTVNQNEGVETYRVHFEYKGENLQDTKTFGFYVQSKNNGVISFGGDDLTLNKDGVFVRDFPISNSRLTDKNDKLEIKIEWNGNSEVFTLLNKGADSE